MEEISPNNILEVSHISASYQEGKQRKTVLHDISFELHENEILGLVGESGCGKSTLSKVILGFIRPDEGEIISQVDHPQMIFQDPFSSLNPAKKISWILEEPLRMQKVPKEERKKRVLAMAERVGLSAEPAPERQHRGRTDPGLTPDPCRRTGFRSRCDDSEADHGADGSASGGASALDSLYLA